MAYSIVYSAFGDGAAATTTGAVPFQSSGINVGDSYLVFVYAVGASSFVLPSSLSLVGTGSGWVLAGRQFTGTEPSSWTITWTTSAAFSYVELVVDGATPYTLYDAIGSNINASSTNLTAPSITPSWTADFLCGVFMSDTQHAVTLPVSLTSQQNTVGSHGYACAIGYTTLSSNAATGTYVATSGTSAASFCITIAYRTQQTSGKLMPNGIYNSITLPTDLFVQNAAAYSGTGALEQMGFGPGFGWAFSGDFGTAVGGATSQVNSYDGSHRLPVGWDVFAGPSVSGVLSPSVGQEPFSSTHTLSGTCYYGSAGNWTPFSGVWVYLVHQSAPTVVLQAALTDADGTYTFYNVSPGNYTVLGVDPTETYNGAIQTFVMPI